MTDSPPDRYDVAIIGAGMAGLSAAIALRQAQPASRVVLLERGGDGVPLFGEGTAELAAFFLGRTLGLGAHLNEDHFTRQGTRFWFTDGDPAQTLGESAEIGPKYLARIPTYLIDHAVLRPEMRRRALALGAECREPANVTRVRLGGAQGQVVELESGEAIWARWVIDASGPAALLARQEGWRRAQSPWQTARARWRGVKDWDSAAVRRAHPDWAAAVYGMRNPAVNYLTGEGWWSAWTPSRGGEVSIALTALAGLPKSAAEMKAFLEQRHPVAREFLANATPVDGAWECRPEPYFECETYCGDGFALVGDAAGALPALYSGSLDWMAVSVTAAVSIVTGKADPTEVNGALCASHTRWFDALYRDKPAYLGEFDLMSVAHIFDQGLYTLGIARPIYLKRAVGAPPFSQPSLMERVLRGSSRRCARLAEGRRRRGELGRSNANQRALYTSFNFNPASVKPLLGALRRWLRLELTEGWRR